MKSKNRKNGANGRKRANGTGTIEKRGSRWRLKFKDPDTGVRVYETIDAASVDEAREILRQRTGDGVMTRQRLIETTQKRLDGVKAERREWEDKQPAVTIDEAWEVFDSDMTSRNRGRGTQRNYGLQYGMFAAWLKEKHPDVTELRRVDSSIAREYYDALRNGDVHRENAREHLTVRGTTVNRHFNALALVWSTLAAHDADGKPVYPKAKLGGNPFAWDKKTKIGIPRVSLKHEERAHRRRVLNLDELAAVVRLAQGEMRVLIALGFYTGLRLGDCVTLTWDSIDRVNGLLTTRSHKTDIETATRIHPALAAVIREEVKTKRGYLLPELAAIYESGQNGEIKVSQMVTDLFEAAGIKTSYQTEEEKAKNLKARPDCGFHSLRHTYVTQLERVGATLAERQLLAGHRTAAMTAHYTHDDQSRVLALPDITAADGADDSRAASEARYAAFCAAWDALGADERQRALDYANAHKAATAVGATIEADTITADADAAAK